MMGVNICLDLKAPNSSLNQSLMSMKIQCQDLALEDGTKIAAGKCFRIGKYKPYKIALPSSRRINESLKSS